MRDWPVWRRLDTRYFIRRVSKHNKARWPRQWGPLPIPLQRHARPSEEDPEVSQQEHDQAKLEVEEGEAEMYHMHWGSELDRQTRNLWSHLLLSMLGGMVKCNQYMSSLQGRIQTDPQVRWQLKQNFVNDRYRTKKSSLGPRRAWLPSRLCWCLLRVRCWRWRRQASHLR